MAGLFLVLFLVVLSGKENGESENFLGENERHSGSSRGNGLLEFDSECNQNDVNANFDYL